MSSPRQKNRWETESTAMTLSDGLVFYTQNYLFMRGFAKSTHDNYRWAVTSFIKVVGDKEISDVTIDDILKWRFYIKEQGWATNAVNAYCYKLRKMLAYFVRKGYSTIDLEDFLIPKKEQKLPTYLSLEEAQRVYRACLDSRERLIVALLFATGIRVSELCQIRTKDIQGDKILIRGKGSRERYVYTDEATRECIAMYLKERNSCSQYLLDSIRGNGLTISSVQGIIKTIGTRSGIDKHLTCHVFRHTYATLLLSNGCNLRHIQELLGHADISTTQIYTHVTNSDLAGSYMKYHVSLT